MPREVFGADFQFLPRDELLTFEEIARLARLFLDATAWRRSASPAASRCCAATSSSWWPCWRGCPGLRDLTLTTNGSLLARKAEALAAAGLRRITVSLDSLDDAVFARLNDVDFPVARVLEGIDAAERAGLAPIKINMVVRRGVNEASVVPMARFFRERGHILRFIEYMDVGHTNGWRLDEVVPAEEILALIDAEMPLEAVPPNYQGEVADRWRYRDGSGEIGVIASVTQPFCGTCTRARLTAEGQLYTCLFGVRGHDFRALLRGGATDEQVSERIRGVWRVRADRYSELRSAATVPLPKVEMSHIGG